MANIKLQSCYSEFPDFLFKTQQFQSFKGLSLHSKGSYSLFKSKSVYLNFVRRMYLRHSHVPMEPGNSYQMSLKQIKGPPGLLSAEQQNPGSRSQRRIEMQHLCVPTPHLSTRRGRGWRGLEF